jgi:uncharacterized membrane protein YjfL (UPF0719 family)
MSIMPNSRYFSIGVMILLSFMIIFTVLTLWLRYAYRTDTKMVRAIDQTCCSVISE